MILDESFASYDASQMAEVFKKAYHGSYYTILGCGGNLDDWKNGYQELFDKENIGKITSWIEFTGNDLNEFCHLEGDNAYPADLACLAFPLNNLNINKLAIFKLNMEDRWFDDIIDNNCNGEFHPIDNSGDDSMLEDYIAQSFDEADEGDIVEHDDDYFVIINKTHNRITLVRYPDGDSQPFTLSINEFNEFINTDSDLLESYKNDLSVLSKDICKATSESDAKSIIGNLKYADKDIYKKAMRIRNQKDLSLADRCTKISNLLKSEEQARLAESLEEKPAEVQNEPEDKVKKLKDRLKDLQEAEEAMEARHDPSEKDDLAEIKEEIAKVEAELKSIDTPITESLNESTENNGLSTILNMLIKDEFDAIQQYNDAIVNFEAEGRTDLVQVLQDILNEENLHVGQLEVLLEQVNGAANSIDQGKAEAETQLATEGGEIVEEDPEEGMHY